MISEPIMQMKNTLEYRVLFQAITEKKKSRAEVTAMIPPRLRVMKAEQTMMSTPNPSTR